MRNLEHVPGDRKSMRSNFLTTVGGQTYGGGFCDAQETQTYGSGYCDAQRNEGGAMKAQLACGAIIDVTLKEGTNIIEFGVAPAEGTKIEDFVKDGVLHINMTLDSFLGRNV